MKNFKIGDLVKFSFPHLDSGWTGGEYFDVKDSDHRNFVAWRGEYENLAGIVLKVRSYYNGFRTPSVQVLFSNNKILIVRSCNIRFLVEDDDE